MKNLNQEKKDILITGLQLLDEFLRTRAVGNDENLESLVQKLKDVKELAEELGGEIKPK